VETKICSKCKEEKGVCEFYKNKDSSDGLRSNCKKCQNKNSTNWRINNPEKFYEIQKKFIKNNPTKPYEYSKKWLDKNIDKNKKYRREYNKIRYNTLPLYKIEKNLRNRLNEIFRERGFNKKNKFIEFLGCDISFLKTYLENKFLDGMSWNNKSFDGWHIDHIIPLSSAKNEEEIFKLCHYTNLQPLWGKDNMIKGSKIL
jgi:hypothetical protein